MSGHAVYFEPRSTNLIRMVVGFRHANENVQITRTGVGGIRGIQIMQVALMFLILVAIYGIVIAGLGQLIRRWRATNRYAIFLSFLTFGLAAGILAVLLWPHDSSVLPNVFGVWVGDWVYVQAIEQIGDPHSSQAHYKIPWVLRVPQVYVITSTGLSALMGLVLQRIVERLRN